MLILAILKNKKVNGGKKPLSKSDIDFYKMTGVFAIACIFVLLVLRMKSTMIMRAASGEDVTYNVYKLLSSPFFIVPALAALAASAVWFAVSKKKKIDESRRIFTSTNCLSIALYLTVFVLCFGKNPNYQNHEFFIAFTVICAVAYYVSKIYNADFTLFSIVTAVNSMTVFLLASKFDAASVIAKLVVLAASVAAIIIVDKKIKSMKISKKRKSGYLTVPAYVSVALGAFCMFIRMNTAFSAALAVDRLLMAFLVEYIVFAIYYTLRLIRD